MEQVVEVARRLREEHDFRGYIHLKTIPEAAPELLQRAGRYADRLSINIELPTDAGLTQLAPEKDGSAIRRSMARLRVHIDDAKEERREAQASPVLSLPRAKPARAQPGAFAAAGQSTQMIVGADATDDATILATSAQLYGAYRPQARLLLRLQPDPGCLLRPAAEGAAAGARTPAVPGRLADALLRLRRRRDRVAAHRRHVAAGGRPEAGMGARAPGALSGRPEPGATRAAAARARTGREGGRPPRARASRAAPARRRPAAAARAAAQGAALRRRRRPPALRVRPIRSGCSPPHGRSAQQAALF
jgi:hypothetical protein